MSDQPQNQEFNIQNVDAKGGVVNFGTLNFGTGNDTPTNNDREHTAILYTSAREILKDDEAYFGYEDERAHVRAALENNARVLITGFSGAGKTTLAAQIMMEWLESGHGPIMHLYLGNKDAEKTLTAIATKFNAEQKVNQQADEKTRYVLLRKLIIENNISLVVYDDAWNGQGLHAALKAVPNQTPVIVTSRQLFDKAFDFHSSIELSRLTSKAALSLLQYHAKGQNTNDGAVLCERLAYLPYTLRLAGKHMNAVGESATKILATFEAAHTLRVPHDFGEKPGRLSLAMLIEHSLAALDDDAVKTFRALGAFFDTRVTPELLSHYFAIREQTIDATQTLATLHFHGLVTRIKGDDENVQSYRVHDLAYEYATVSTDDEERGQALEACLSIIQSENQSETKHFDELMPLLDQFDGAQAWALVTERWKDVEQFSRVLFESQGNQVGLIFAFKLWTRGCSLLNRAILASEQLGDKQNLSAHLTNRAGCYINLAQYNMALTDCMRAMAIKEKIGDQADIAITILRIGEIHLANKSYDEARQTFEKVRKIAQETNRTDILAATISNLASVDKQQGKFEQSIKGYRHAMVLYRENGDEHRYLINQISLGGCYLLWGRYEEAQQILESVQVNNGHASGAILAFYDAVLGFLYRDGFEDIDRASKHFDTALTAWQKKDASELIRIQETIEAIARIRAKLDGDER